MAFRGFNAVTGQPTLQFLICSALRRMGASCRSLIPAVFALSLLSSVIQAATPRDELLRLVPEDVGFCLLFEDLRSHSEALLNSPFAKVLFQSPGAAKLAQGDEAQKLDFVDKWLQQFLHIKPGQLRDDILGDALVVAYRPGPPGRPEQEQGLFLLRARDGQLLAGLIDRLNELQKDAGDLKELAERDYKGRKYLRRQDHKDVNFYFVNGPVLAFSPKEELLQQVIDLDLKEAREQEAPVAREFRLLGIDKPLAAVWVNPRAFDTALRLKVEGTQGAQAAVLRSVFSYWKALEGIAVSVVLDKDFELKFAFRARGSDLPEAVRRLARTAAEPSELWRSFPGDAMLAAAGRLDLGALADVLDAFLTDDARKTLHSAVDGSVGAILGKEILKEVLPHLGPDFGFCVVAPARGDSNWLPFGIVALRIQPGPDGERAGLALLHTLDALATLAVFHANGGHPGPLTLKFALQDRIEVKFLANDRQFPPGFQPAFGLKDGYLVLGTSPEAIRRFKAGATVRKEPEAIKESALLRLSLRTFGAYLKDHRGPLAAYTSSQHQIPADEAGRRLDALISALQFFDRVEFSQARSAGRLILTVRLRMSEPLK